MTTGVELAEVIEAETVEPSTPYVWPAEGSFGEEVATVLMEPTDPDDIEIRPDGLLYLPAALYRFKLNRAFGSGAWCILPLDISKDGGNLFYRGALFAHGRFVAEAIGEQQLTKNMTFATAVESAKSNCLTRCCKDLGIANELWQLAFTRRWIAKYAVKVWCENKQTNEKKPYWRRNDAPPIDQWPWVENDPRTSGTMYSRQMSNKAIEGRAQAKSNGSKGQPGLSGQPTPKTPGESKPTPATGNSEADTITFRQMKRLRAIEAEVGWEDAEVKFLIAKLGHESRNDIRTGEEYDKVCRWLENADNRSKVRTELFKDQVENAGDPQVDGNGNRVIGSEDDPPSELFDKGKDDSSITAITE